MAVIRYARQHGTKRPWLARLMDRRPIKVAWIPDLLLRSETHGDYRIVAAMPDRDGDHMYRIKSPLEEYERVVKEDLLVKSDGYLPEGTPTRVSRYGSITLPTLQPAYAKALHSSSGRDQNIGEDPNRRRQFQYRHARN